MHTLVFIAPSLVAAFSFVTYYLARPKDLGAIALQLATEETRTQSENEAWSNALVARQAGNRTLKGY